MTRKIIQLAADESWLYALCDDGTLWQGSGSGGWSRCEAIPQEETDPPIEIPPAPVPLTPAWLKPLLGLWAVNREHLAAYRILDDTDLRQYGSNTAVALVEARDPDEARRVYCDYRRVPGCQMKLNAEGKQFDFISDQIPF